MERTDFAGLTVLSLVEPLSTDGGSFMSRNPTIIDLLLRVGAVAHRHDGHTAMDDPITAPTVATADTGGVIESDTAIYVLYTVLDADGGESLPAPLDVVTTRAGLLATDDSPDLALSSSAGTLLAGNYYYAVTITDGAGGETPLGPSATITIPPGPSGNTVTVTGLAALAASVGGAGWRLWRMIDGADWRRVADGAGAIVIDDGTLCPDCTGSPPLSTSRTNATSTLQVTVPATLPAGAVQLRIYASLDGSFESPAILGTYPIADAGTVKEYGSLALLDGAPPEVSLALPGANQISLETDIVSNPWREAVANAAALPAAGNTNGDVRETLNDHHLHVWTGAAWVDVASGGGGGGGGHVIQDENAAGLSARAILAFQGAGVTATDDAANDRTLITIPGGGGGPGINWRGAWNGLAAYAVGDGVTHDGSSFRAIAPTSAPAPPAPIAGDPTTIDAPGLADGVDFTESMAARMHYSGSEGTYVWVRVTVAGTVELRLTNNLVGTGGVLSADMTPYGGPAGATCVVGDTINDVVTLGVGDHWIRTRVQYWGTTPTGGTYTIRATALTAEISDGNPEPVEGATWAVIAAAGTGGVGGSTLNWRGDWNGAATYATNDVARYGSDLWIATRANAPGEVAPSRLAGGVARGKPYQSVEVGPYSGALTDADSPLATTYADAVGAGDHRSDLYRIDTLGTGQVHIQNTSGRPLHVYVYHIDDSPGAVADQFALADGATHNIDVGPGAYFGHAFYFEIVGGGTPWPGSTAVALGAYSFAVTITTATVAPFDLGWELFLPGAAGGGSGGLSSRETVSFALPMTTDQKVAADLALPKCYQLLKVTSATLVRVELYVSAAARAADASRADGAPLGAAGHGCIIDADIDEASSLTFTPAVVGFNNDDPAVDVGYAAITAQEDGDVVVDFTVVRTEA